MHLKQTNWETGKSPVSRSANAVPRQTAHIWETWGVPHYSNRFFSCSEKKQLVCVPYSDVLLRAHPETLLHSPACAWINMRQNDGMIVTLRALAAPAAAERCVRVECVRAGRPIIWWGRRRFYHQVTKKQREVNAALITCVEELFVWFVWNTATLWINNAFNTRVIAFHVLTCWILH